MAGEDIDRFTVPESDVDFVVLPVSGVPPPIDETPVPSVNPAASRMARVTP
jgi:hypothetical protein